MTNIKHIYCFGDSHVAGDELCSPEIPKLQEYLKTVESNHITDAVKVPQKNLDNIYFKVREIYQGHFASKKDLRANENKKSFPGQLATLLDCGYDNYAESGSSNLQSYIQFIDILPSIKQLANTLNSNDKILIIYGLTEIERSTFIDVDCKPRARSPLWNLHNEHRKDAEKYIELQDQFGDDTLIKLFQIHMQINAICGLLPNNCNVVFVDPTGLFIDRNKVGIKTHNNQPFIRIQSYEDGIDDSLKEVANQVHTLIRDHMFNDCMYSVNVYNNFDNKEDFYKLMPLSHFTEQHHRQFALLLYNYIVQ